MTLAGDPDEEYTTLPTRLQDAHADFLADRITLRELDERVGQLLAAGIQDEVDVERHAADISLFRMPRMERIAT